MASAALRPKRLFGLITLLAAATIATAPVLIADEKSRLTEEVTESRAEFLKKDPSLEKEMASASGYALFPGVGKGAIGVGGARGTGQVIIGGSPVARATLTQVNIGLQLGGQKYAELIPEQGGARQLPVRHLHLRRTGERCGSRLGCRRQREVFRRCQSDHDADRRVDVRSERRRPEIRDSALLGGVACAHFFLWL
jgi:hypothetical protein